MTYCSRLAVAAARVVVAGIILQAAWAQLPSGTLRDWGNNTSGQLGNGTYTSSSLPIPIAGLGDVVSVSTGSMHGLAAKADGTVWAWGDNFFGELGNGTNTNSAAPVRVTGLTGVVRVSAGQVFSMALKSDGTVWTWGLNQDGALGNGTRVSSNTPVQVCCLLDHVVEIAA